MADEIPQELIDAGYEAVAPLIVGCAPGRSRAIDDQLTAILAAVLPLHRKQVIAEVEEALLANWSDEGSAVDEAARHIAHGFPGGHPAWRGRTRGALSVALAVALADLKGGTDA